MILLFISRETARNLVEEGKLSLETVKIQPSPPPAPMPLLRTTRIEAIVIQVRKCWIGFTEWLKLIFGYYFQTLMILN